jgi:hypothetical protein
MKKTVIALILGLVMLASANYFLAVADPPGPPSGAHPLAVGFFGGPPFPPPGPPPFVGGFIGGRPGPPLGPPPLGLLDGPPDLIKKLKLTDDQLKEMRLGYVDFQSKTRKARTSLMGLHDEKRTMLISGKIDQAKLAKLDEDITKLMAEVMSEDLKMKREQLSKLTPEQVNLLADFLSKPGIAHAPKMTAR